MIRTIRLIIFLLVIIALQTALCARLPIWGAYPDLVLIAVIVFAVREQFGPGLIFAFFSGLFQDLSGTGAFLNTLTKPLAAVLISFIKENFLEDDTLLVYYMVLALTPLFMVSKALIVGEALIWSNYLFATLYNLFLTPFVSWSVKKFGT